MQMLTGLSFITFNTYMRLKTGKIGTFDINRDSLGTQLVKKVPIGTRVPKWLGVVRTHVKKIVLQVWFNSVSL